MATMILDKARGNIINVLKEELVRVIPFRYDTATQPQTLALGSTYPLVDFKNISGGSETSGVEMIKQVGNSFFQTTNKVLDNTQMLFPFGAGNECRQVALVKLASVGNYKVNGLINVNISAGVTDNSYLINSIKIEVA